METAKETYKYGGIAEILTQLFPHFLQNMWSILLKIHVRSSSHSSRQNSITNAQ